MSPQLDETQSSLAEWGLGATAPEIFFAEDVAGFLFEKAAEGRRVALVTLIEIDGSSPRPLGAQMGVSECGAAQGYLSGGCLERAIVLEAQAAIEEQCNRQVRYGKGSRYIDITLPCGSAIELYFDVGVSCDTLRELRRAQMERRSVATLTDIAQLGSARLIDTIGPTGLENGVFRRQYSPPLRLLLAGSGANAVYLARLASGVGLQTHLYSPDPQTIAMAAPYVKESFALSTPASTPPFRADSRTAVATVFHDHDWEPRILQHALNTDAFYIGAMGSVRTHAARLQTLARLGLSEEELRRIKGPAGLSSHARTAPEIGASILAEILNEARLAETESAL